MDATTTRSDTFLRPSTAEVFDFRVRTDRGHTDVRLADELELRARLLRETVEIPEADRQPYERVADLVASFTYGNDWRAGRIARRIWLTGESILHANFVLFGTQDGRGCDCRSPECVARREELERR
jgi:hypothetical protein